MEFIYPEFLFALSALAIPIIIHLFNFRKFKKVYFSDISFLKEIKIETQSRSRIRHLLILLARMLVFTFLIFAFAQPYIPISKNSSTQGTENVSIYVDNSFSMGARSTDGILLDIAKQKALEIANQFDITDNFQLVTNNFEAIEQRIYNKDEIIDLIGDVKIGANTRTLSKVIDRQNAVVSKEMGNKKLFVISDFQATMANIEAINKDSLTEVFFVPLEAEYFSNTYVDSVWFTEPNRIINNNDVIHFRIIHNGENDRENLPVKLLINGKQKASTTVNLKANSTLDTAIHFVNTHFGWHHTELVVDDYPITYDNSFYCSYNIADSTNVLYINNDESNFIEPIFGKSNFYNLIQTNAKNIDYSSIENYQTITLSGLNEIPSGVIQGIKNVVENGGNCILFPGKEANKNSYNNFLRAFSKLSIGNKISRSLRVNQFDDKHPLYAPVFESIPQNVDLPKVNEYYELNINSSIAANTLMRLQNNVPFLSEIEIGNGHLYWFASPLNAESSNLTRHALLVPTLLRIAETSHPSSLLYYTIGTKNNHVLKNSTTSGDQVFKLKDLDNKFEFIPEQKQIGKQSVLSLDNAIEQAGSYTLSLDKNIVDALSFNYNRNESKSGFYSISEIEQRIKNTGYENIYLLDLETTLAKNQLIDLKGGKQYWKWCLIFALLFLLSEIILIRIKK